MSTPKALTRANTRGLQPPRSNNTVSRWSPRLFARLSALGVDIITYRKGKRRLLPRSAFREHKVQEDGQEKTYWLCDQPRVRVCRLRPRRKGRRQAGEPEYLWLRQITVLR